MLVYDHIKNTLDFEFVTQLVITNILYLDLVIHCVSQYSQFNNTKLTMCYHNVILVISRVVRATPEQGRKDMSTQEALGSYNQYNWI